MFVSACNFLSISAINSSNQEVLRNKLLKRLNSSDFIIWHVCYCSCVELNTDQLTYCQQHALDLLEGSQTAKECNQGYNGTSGDENVHSTQEQVGAQQLIHKGFVHQGPDTNPQHCNTANLERPK